MILLKVLEFAAYLLLFGIFMIAVSLVILAMCAVASDADEKTEEWLKKEGRLNDEGD